MEPQPTAVKSGDTKATVSMVLGLCSLLCAFFTGIPAVIVGFLALGKASPSGKTRAWVGIASGGVLSVAWAGLTALSLWSYWQVQGQSGASSAVYRRPGVDEDEMASKHRGPTPQAAGAMTADAFVSRYGDYLHHPISKWETVLKITEERGCRDVRKKEEDLGEAYRSKKIDDRGLKSLGFPPIVLRTTSCTERSGVEVEVEGDPAERVYTVKLVGPANKVVAVAFDEYFSKIATPEALSVLRPLANAYANKAGRGAEALQSGWEPVQTHEAKGFTLLLMPTQTMANWAVRLMSTRKDPDTTEKALPTQPQ